MSSPSPLAPTGFPQLPPVRGVSLAAHAAGLRYRGRPDVMLAVVAPGTTVAGTLTRSLSPSAPVDWCRRLLPSGAGRALVCNAGNANAFTGSAGHAVAAATARSAASALDLEPDDIYLASTGVIGEPLPETAIAEAVDPLVASLAPSSPQTWQLVAEAIRTTDTYAKGAAVPVGDSGAVVVGVAKGSGMIAPDMATMLAFVFTDVAVGVDDLRAATHRAVDRSFNCITVDSDTSTSDTALVFATGQAGAVPNAEFEAALSAVMLDLAQQIVRDGEGATKFAEVTVEGAASDAAARVVALAVANSPLVKTALAAGDANWGRIVAAVGKAGEMADRDSLRIWIGDELTAENGARAAGYSEDRASEHLAGDEIRIRVDVGVGTGRATVWTCDLTHGYIEINAGYRS